MGYKRSYWIADGTRKGHVECLVDPKKIRLDVWWIQERSCRMSEVSKWDHMGWLMDTKIIILYVGWTQERLYWMSVKTDKDHIGNLVDPNNFILVVWFIQERSYRCLMSDGRSKKDYLECLNMQINTSPCLMVMFEHPPRDFCGSPNTENKW